MMLNCAKVAEIKVMTVVSVSRASSFYHVIKSILSFVKGLMKTVSSFKTNFLRLCCASTL